MDITPAHQHTRFSWNGKRLSAIGHIAKEMMPQAWYRGGLICKADGPIIASTPGDPRGTHPEA